MTALLVSVRDIAEAVIARDGGTDMLDWEGDPAALPALRAQLGADVRLSLAATTGAPSDVDHLRVVWPPATDAPLPAGTLGVVRNPAEGEAAVASAVAAGLAGLMVDTTSEGRLLDRAGIDALAAFTAACRAAHLLSGLGGSLEAPDIPRLRLVRPDILRVRGGVRRGGRLDADALRIVRDLLPRDDARTAPPPAVAETDCVFVHDFVVPVSIGAYGRERTSPQRVRFDVDVDVRRLAGATRDMRDVFSYDLVLDAIRLIVGRGHVLFVEQVAEEIAAAVLAHPRVETVAVRAQKLDVVPGTLGVAIRRTRADRSVTP